MTAKGNPKVIKLQTARMFPITNRAFTVCNTQLQQRFQKQKAIMQKINNIGSGGEKMGKWRKN